MVNIISLLTYLLNQLINQLIANYLMLDTLNTIIISIYLYLYASLKRALFSTQCALVRHTIVTYIKQVHCNTIKITCDVHCNLKKNELELQM